MAGEDFCAAFVEEAGADSGVGEGGCEHEAVWGRSVLEGLEEGGDGKDR